MGARHRFVTSVCVGVVALGAAAVVPVVPEAAANGKVTICHRTHSVKNPYRMITVAQAAVNGSGTNDHTGHLGAPFDKGYAYPPNAKVWGDVIPGGGGTGAGVNWTDHGKAIFHGTSYGGHDYAGTCGTMTAQAFYNSEREAGVPAADILADLQGQEAEGDPLPDDPTWSSLTYTGTDPSVPESPTYVAPEPQPAPTATEEPADSDTATVGIEEPAPSGSAQPTAPAEQPAPAPAVVPLPADPAPVAAPPVAAPPVAAPPVAPAPEVAQPVVPEAPVVPAPPVVPPPAPAPRVTASPSPADPSVPATPSPAAPPTPATSATPSPTPAAAPAATPNPRVPTAAPSPTPAPTRTPAPVAAPRGPLPAPPPAVPVGAQSITGTVWLDLDADGGQTRSEPGMPELEVRLVATTSTPSRLVAALRQEPRLAAAVTAPAPAGPVTVLARTRTDSRGDFVFPDLAVGGYRVEVSVPAALRVTLNSQGDTAPEAAVVLPPGGKEHAWAGLVGDAGLRASLQAPPGSATADEVTVRWAGPDGVAGTADDVLLTAPVVDGQVELSGLPAGEYSVDWPGSGAATTLQLADGTPRDVTLVARASRSGDRTPAGEPAATGTDAAATDVRRRAVVPAGAALPRTGSGVDAVLPAGVAMVVLGTLLQVVARRRRA